MLKIKELRLEKGYTQKELGEKTNTTNKNIWAWENGIASPDISMLIELAKVFDVTVDYLIGNDPDDFSATRTQTIAPMSAALSPDEQELLQYFNELDSEDKRSVLRVARSLSSEKKSRSAGKVAN